MPDYYEMLQVSEDADYQKIDAAYWRLVRETTASSDEAQYTVDDLNQAYELLRTPVLRQRYDASHAREPKGDRAHSDRASKPESTPAAPSREGVPSTGAVGIEGGLVHTLQLEVRQVRDRMRERNATMEIPGDQQAQSPLQRMFGRLR